MNPISALIKGVGRRVKSLVYSWFALSLFGESWRGAFGELERGFRAYGYNLHNNLPVHLHHRGAHDLDREPGLYEVAGIASHRLQFG